VSFFHNVVEHAKAALFPLIKNKSIVRCEVYSKDKNQLGNLWNEHELTFSSFPGREDMCVAKLESVNSHISVLQKPTMNISYYLSRFADAFVSRFHYSCFLKNKASFVRYQPWKRRERTSQLTDLIKIRL